MSARIAENCCAVNSAERGEQRVWVTRSEEIEECEENADRGE